MKANSEMVFLREFDGDRKNNFTLIRLVFAWLVLYGHSFAIQPTHGLKNPLHAIFQGSTWIGAVAVNGFFVISGFLVCASLLNRSIKDYVISRVLRVLPALVVCVLLSVFVLGAALTTLPLSEYFQHSDTFGYLKNALAIFSMEWTLPGVFESNRRSAMNGSLWTLTVEVYCYILLAFFGFWGLLRKKSVANFTIFALLVFGFFHFADIPLLGVNMKWSRPGLYFLLGVLLYCNRDMVPVSGKLALFSVLVVLYSFGKSWFPYVFPLFFAYLIFYLAYATRFVDLDGKLGDVSYGVYIYAWPTQQVIAMTLPELNPYTHTLLATFVVFLLAYCSWRYIERPALNLKPRLMAVDFRFFQGRVASQG